MTELTTTLQMIPFLEKVDVRIPRNIELANTEKIGLVIYMTPRVPLNSDLVNSITLCLAKIPNYEFDCTVTYAKPKTLLQWLQKLGHSLSIYRRQDKVHLSYKCSSV